MMQQFKTMASLPSALGFLVLSLHASVASSSLAPQSLPTAPSASSSGASPQQPRGSMRGSVDPRLLERELSEAMAEVLGCGGLVDQSHLQELERKLAPMYNTFPKNAAGNIDRRSLRYLVHRHFSREAALHIRGFEPSRSASAAGWGDADILSQRVPAFVEAVLESRHKLDAGFALADVAHMVKVLEQLIFDSEGAVLEKVYKEEGRALDEPMSRENLRQLLESYMLHWMVGDDQESIDFLLANRSLLPTAIPHWDQVAAFAHGQAQALDYVRATKPKASESRRHGQNALTNEYAFEDVHSVVGDITKSFASFWTSECSSMKAQLVDMDTHHTGRVPLAKFYGTGLDADWRFGESEEYLRELGALDETSWRGKQVIIPNYLQAASNCIVSSEHYLVCCANDCEALLDEIETKIAAPTASPETIVSIVRNMSASTASLDDDLDSAAPQLDASLLAQLDQIASAHGGEVPVHGRLFAQWLHYVFPRDCPFPHKSGTVATATPLQYGENYVASSEEMEKYASQANASDIPLSMGKEELEWMSQWSPEEELITEQVSLRAPWQGPGTGVMALGGLALLALGFAFKGVGVGGRKAEAGLLPYHAKAHFV